VALILPEFADPYATGTTPAYLQMAAVHVDFGRMTATIRLGIYRDAAAAEAGKEPIESRTILLGGPAPPGRGRGAPGLDRVLGDNAAAIEQLRQYLYGLIRTLPEYAGAVDAEAPPSPPA
jgi:hypothetical protein